MPRGIVDDVADDWITVLVLPDEEVDGAIIEPTEIRNVPPDQELAGGVETGTPVEVDGDVIMADDDEVRWQSGKIRAVGNPEQPKLRLSLNRGRNIEWSPQELGAEPRSWQQLDQEKVWFRIVPGEGGADTIECAWSQPGVVEAAWARYEERLREEAARQHRVELRDVRARAQRDDVFVNPYTFVPLPQGKCARHEPRGHEKLGNESLSGEISVAWTALAPLLLRGEVHPENDHWRPHRLADDRVLIPGSGIKGAIRSLHETITGGCLRVLDTDFVPVYRAPAITPTEPWTLARVETTDEDGRPEEIRLCDQVVWVKAEWIPETCRHTGAECRIDPEHIAPEGPANRKTLTTGGGIAADSGDGDRWVLHFSDHEARNRRRPYYAAAGRLSGRLGFLPRAEGMGDAWTRYQRAASGSSDVVRELAGPGSESDTEVKLNLGGAVAQRQRVRMTMQDGDVIWVLPDLNSAAGDAPIPIQEIKRAVFWRELGQGPMGDRVDASYHPCSDSETLCSSCSVFGSADTDERRTAAGVETWNYRGHVRVSDAVSRDPVPPDDPIALRPMLEPRPGAGQFYLQNDDVRPAQNAQDRPAREWGATPDRRGNQCDRSTYRQMRGRKHYWPSAGEPPPKRYRQTAQEAAAHPGVTTRAELVPSGTVFEATIRFVNLDRGQVGSLLAACNPNLLLEKEVPAGFAETATDLTVALGGGKGLGLGTVRPEIEGLRLYEGPERYVGGGRPAEKTPEEMKELVTEYAEKAPDTIKGTWPHLAAALHAGHVNSERIGYPGFNFFKNSSGRFLRRERVDMTTLPEATAANQYLDTRGRGN